MFKKFFKDLIVSSMECYIEDFTEQDIKIDNWNGIVVKENAVIKITALQSLMRSLVGAPVNVRTGYCRKIRVTVPWSEILSKPCEIYLDELHAVCDSPAGFDKAFAQKTHHLAKMKKFEQLLKQFNVSASIFQS